VITLHRLGGLGRATTATTEAARGKLREIITSKLFRTHKMLGRVSQVLGFLGLFFYFSENWVVRKLTEMGVLVLDKDLDLLETTKLSGRALLDANCANLLVSLLRSVLAIIVLKTHSVRESRRRARRVVAERRRGLLEKEMDALRKEIFKVGAGSPVRGASTSSSTSTRPVCSICLDRFNSGDNVWILPCDERHIFHDNCIKSWLRKNNSCPLCQRNVVNIDVEE